MSKPTLRQSQISDYQKCPKCYYKKHVLGQVAQPNSKMTIGSACDAVMNSALISKMKGQQMSIAEATQFVADQMDQRKDGTDWFEDDFGQCKDHAVAVAAKIIGEVCLTIDPVVVQADFYIETDLPFDFVGTIDYIDKQRRVRDLKVTTRQGVSGYKINGAIQPAGYTFAAQCLIGEVNGFVIDRMTRPTIKIGAEYQPLVGTVTKEDINNFWETALDVWNAIQKGVFPRAFERSFYCDCGKAKAA